MGLLLDLAVAVLALVVIGSLAALAWTLAVSATRATRHGRERVASARHTVTEFDGRMREATALATARLAALTERTAPDRYEPPGDRPEA